LNLAICNARKEDWNEVVYYTTKVLEIDPTQCRALFYRILAYHRMMEMDKSANDVEVLEQERPPKELEKAFAELERAQKQYNRIKEHEGEIYKKMIKAYYKSSNIIKI
jgi:hypothetical protein